MKYIGPSKSSLIITEREQIGSVFERDTKLFLMEAVVMPGCHLKIHGDYDTVYILDSDIQGKLVLPETVKQVFVDGKSMVRCSQAISGAQLNVIPETQVLRIACM
jgi:hypothetical protein